jgi:hypothetical protein
MGASLAMIDVHYGHLARDGREHAVALLDALAAEETAWTFGGRRNGNPQRWADPWDVLWASRRPRVVYVVNTRSLYAGSFLKPPDGLEPSTPSLP